MILSAALASVVSVHMRATRMLEGRPGLEIVAAVAGGGFAVVARTMRPILKLRADLLTCDLSEWGRNVIMEKDVKAESSRGVADHCRENKGVGRQVDPAGPRDA